MKSYRLIRMAVIVLLSLCVMFPADADAHRHPVHKLNYFQSEVIESNGQKVLHIEVGMNRSDLEYSAEADNMTPNVLHIDMQNTDIDKLRREIKLEGKIGNKLEFKELERRHVRMDITTVKPLEKDGWKVYTLPSDRHKDIPYRLAIDIVKPPEKPKAPSVSGVSGRTIVIDPGHGGSDSGARGPSGLLEKDVTLAVSSDLRKILETSGARVVMTRDTDVDVYGPYATDRQELQARVNVGAYTPGMDIFVSIPCNAFTSSSANGTQTFYYPKSSDDAQLASFIQDELIAACGRRDRGISTANFYVVKHTEQPAVLIELAFITNPTEQALLGSADFQQKLAFAIARGISRYFSR